MATIYAQANIRAQLSILSNPPVGPIDINTGLAPAFWRAAGIQIDAGIFNVSQTGLDLSNLISLTCNVQPSPTSPVAWASKTVLAVDIVSPIDFGDWVDGLSQNASFVFTPADTDLGLRAGASRSFWMTIVGTTAAGGTIIYGAGYITIYNPGASLPPPGGSLVSWHAQANAGGNAQVVPTGLEHTEEIAFNGSAGVCNIVLQAAGYPRGSRVSILALFPNLTPNIVLNIYSGSLTGSPIFTFTTDAYQPNALFVATVNDVLGYNPTMQLIPAFQ